MKHIFHLLILLCCFSCGAEKMVLYSCSNNVSVCVYPNKKWTKVRMEVFEGEQLMANVKLEYDQPASGVRFSNENWTYWSKGNSAFVMYQDSVVYEHCYTKD